MIIFMDILNKLFGSGARVRLMRLFLLNPGTAFNQSEAMKKAKVATGDWRREMGVLLATDLVKESKRVVETKRKKKTEERRYQLQANFPYREQLLQLLDSEFLERRREIAQRLKKSGNIKLLVLSGIFCLGSRHRVDILIVGDRLKRNLIDGVMKNFEAEFGKELVYAVLDVNEFNYRYYSSDKFIRDIFDYPHERLLDLFQLS